MSKFFTYEERLDLQKYLKNSLSFKEISRRLQKNPTTISREVRKYSSEVATGYPGFPFNPCKTASTAEKRTSVVRNVHANLLSTVSFALTVLQIVMITLRKSVPPNSEFPMYVMAVNPLENVAC